MACSSIPFDTGDTIITGVNEYASNYLAFLQVARRTGAVVEPVASELDGTIEIGRAHV